MLTLKLAGIVLAATSLGGLGLLALYQWSRPRGRVWLPGALHGALGLTGMVLLLFGLQGPRRGVEMGAGSFGTVAAFLVGGGLLAGLVVFTGRLRRRPPSGLLLGLHATLAVAGLVMLAAYLSSPA